MAGARRVGELLTRLSETDGRKMRADRLHHLLFLCESWAQAIHGRPLFPETVRAAGAGPRIRHPEADPDPKTPDAEEAHLIHRVYQRYGHLPASDLHGIVTAEGTPWSNAYFGAGEGAVIGDAAMREWATRLALAGRPRAPDPAEIDTPLPN